MPRARILLVEDDEALRDVVERNLLARGHDVSIAADARSAPVVVLSAVRVSPGRLAEFRPLAYLPKPFPIEALLRLAAEAASRRNESRDILDVENPASNEEELHA